MDARAIRAVWAFALVLGSASVAQAGGWTQPEGRYYGKAWARGLFGERVYDAEGEVVDSPAFRDVQLNLYAEYGLTDDWTLLSFLTPLGHASADRAAAYVGPLGVGVRRALTTGTYRLALEGQYVFAPGVGERNLFDPPPMGVQPIVYVPAIQNHRGELQLQLGRGLPFGWAVVGAGARLNSADGVDPAIVASAQLGFQLGQRLQLSLNVQTYQPLGEVEVANGSGVGQTRYLGVGIGLAYHFGEHLGATAQLDGGAARSNAATVSVQAGAEVK